jgi:uncharacterized heparinase superfamily protein
MAVWAAIVIINLPNIAWSQTCMEQMSVAEAEINELIARSQNATSIRVQCELLVQALDVQIAFLSRCPEADPTGEDRIAYQATRDGAANCAATF